MIMIEASPRWDRDWLLRHFPTREALFDALLRTDLDALTQKAGELETSSSPGEALVSWFREGVAFFDSYGGVVALMAAAHADPTPRFMLHAQRCTQRARDYCSALRPKERRAPISMGTTCSP
jgi:AcrR family transcriptional regulator